MADPVVVVPPKDPVIDPPAPPVDTPLIEVHQFSKGVQEFLGVVARLLGIEVPFSDAEAAKIKAETPPPQPTLEWNVVSQKWEIPSNQS